MLLFHTHKDNALSLETDGFFGIDPEASLEEFFRLKNECRETARTVEDATASVHVQKL
jgi:hypothetical protein